MTERSFICPYCSQSLDVMVEPCGQPVICPVCNHEVQISPTGCLVRQNSDPTSAGPITPPSATQKGFCQKCGGRYRNNETKCVHCGFVLNIQSYEFIADKIGLLPNIRAKDNLFQGVFTLAFTISGAIVGMFPYGALGAGLGALAGLVCGGLISGIILCIVGLVRK